MLKFDIIKQSNLARVGVIHTPHGDIQTPAFIGAATRAAVKALTVDQMKSIGSQAILANTYHLLLAPGTELIAQAGGLAHFTNWNAPSFTDSGGFQILSLPDVKITEEGATFKSHINGDRISITPELSMQAQWQIGADIHMAFDHVQNTTDHQVMLTAMHRTHRWLERCLQAHQTLTQSTTTPQFLYAVVQGGTFPDLREISATFMKDLPVDGYGIGSLYSAQPAAQILPLVNSILPNQKPRHLLGMGSEPADLFVGAEFGCDTFDCVGPTRMARNGSLYTKHGRININNARFRHDFSPIDPQCDCPLCQNYSAAYLHHLFKVGEITGKTLASLHNERFVIRTVDQIRQAILDDNFQQFKDDFLSNYYHTNYK